MSRPKIALAFLLLVLAALAGYVLLLSGGGRSAPPAREVPSALANVAPTIPKWSGSSTRKPTTTFLRSGVQLSLDQVSFRGLNTTLAGVTFSFSLPKQGRTPTWLTSTHFQLVGADGRVWSPVVSTRVGGPTVYVTVRKTGLPTRALASGSILLMVRVPGDAPFSLAALPPTPPEGHSFAEHKAASSTAGHKSSRHGKRKH